MMKKDELKAAIKLFNAQNPNQRKLTIGGNGAELRNRLQGAHSTEEASPLAPESTVASTAITNVVKGAGPETILPSGKGIHPLTEQCMEIMNVEFDTAAIKKMLKGQEESRLRTMLQPMETFVGMLVDTINGMFETSSSPALNFATVAKIMRGKMSRPGAPDLTHLPKAAHTIFTAFGVDPTTAPPQHEGPVEASNEASQDSVELRIQRRVAQDIAESSSPAHSSDGSRPPTPSVGDDKSPTPTQSSVDGVYVRQIQVISRGVTEMLREWQKTFPKPDVRAWPQDFDTTELDDVRTFIRNFVDDENNGVDSSQSKQSDETTKPAVQALLSHDDFPVPEAKIETVVRAAFRDVCYAMYLKIMKAAARRIMAEAEGVEGHGCRNEDGEGEGEGDGPGPSSKRS